jgi:predicted AAA+ superfamily ATPase
MPGTKEQARFHDRLLQERLPRLRTAFVSGPRQVGKTTSCRALSARYLDWNEPADRLLILQGPDAVARHLRLDEAREREMTVVIDNLHGHRHWKSFLRKFQARFRTRARLVITLLQAAQERRKSLPPNSSLLRINPWSVAECAHPAPADSPIRTPTNISDADWATLLEHGGFPEPFRRRDPHFTRRWQIRRQSQLIDQDLPRLAPVRDPTLIQLLALLLSGRSATSLIYSELSRELGVTVDTIRRWLDLLVGLQHGFRVRPWSVGVPKALRKEPKWFLRDWSAVTDSRARMQTFVACHLLKAVEGWTDLGFGQFELRYLRDKRKREVDFLMLRDRRPWFLVVVCREAPATGKADPVLAYFQRITRAQHAFHLVMNGSFSGADCFAQSEPAVVAARTLLSQLL